MPPARAGQPPINTFEFVETPKRRELRAQLTDSTAGSLADAFTAFLAGRAGMPLPPGLGRSRLDPNGRSGTQIEQPMLPPGEVLDLTPHEVTSDPSSSAGTPAVDGGDRPDIQRLAEIFREQNGKLRLNHPYLKASGKLDYARRLACLYLYYEELRERRTVPRNDLTDVLEDAQVYDGNFRTWLASNPYIRADADGVHLLLPGRQHALATLDQMSNLDGHDEWVPGKKGSSKKTRSRSSDNESKDTATPTKSPRGGVNRTKQADAWLASWKQLAILVDGHSAMQSRKNWEKGLLGLWAIRRATQDVAKEVSRVHLSAFLWAAFEIKINDRTLSAALESEAAKGKVEKVKGTMYQALPPGMAYIENLLGLGTKPSTSPGKGKK